MDRISLAEAKLAKRLNRLLVRSAWPIDRDGERANRADATRSLCVEQGRDVPEDALKSISMLWGDGEDKPIGIAEVCKRSPVVVNPDEAGRGIASPDPKLLCDADQRRTVLTL
jgi:hypothetical protein